MRTQSIRTKFFALVIAIVVAAAIWSAWPASHVLALQDSEDMPSPVGIALGQTAQLTVFNSGEERGIIIIGGKFLDSDNNILSEFSREPVEVAPGQMMSFDLDGDSLDHPRDRFGRIQIRGVVTALGGPDTKRNIHVSLEVFNNSDGKTTVFIGKGVIKGFNPQPDPPGSPQ
jgi:hypothetical protein